MSVTTIEPTASPHEILMTAGLLTFPGFLTVTEVARLRTAAEHVRDAYHRHIDAHRPDMVDSVCMRHLEEPFWHPGEQAHRLTLLEFGADARFVGAVEQCFQGPAMYCSSSLFIHARHVSREGDWHRDLQFIHFGDESKVQESIRQDLWAVQFQISLYDNADIEYVPYSPTRYDSPEEYRVRVADSGSHARDPMPHSVRIHQRAGDAMLFNPNGLHRGRYHTDKPRLTLMYTYTPFGKTQFNEFTYSPWMAAPGFMEGLSRRSRAFYADFVEHYEGFWKSEVRASAFR